MAPASQHEVTAEAIYHLRFQVNKDDVFDDLGRIIQSSRTKTFDIRSAYDFRKAIAEIARDLETSRLSERPH
jgi:hypothetical protein